MGKGLSGEWRYDLGDLGPARGRTDDANDRVECTSGDSR